MRLTAWRIVKASRAANAFDGEGARRFGGRWNSTGTRMVYTSGSQSLAVLEILVHLNGASRSFNFKIIPVEFNGELVEDLQWADLPKHWDALSVGRKTQCLGDEWVAHGTKPVMRVPSAIVPTESNFLLNPLHRRFSEVQAGNPVDFHLDSRLV